MPIEAQVRRYYVRKASAKIRSIAPTVIAIAGSYGKTTTKEITATLIQKLGKTLKPPGNTNTLLGVTRLINETLDSSYQYLVAELGDYVRGDIRELCELVKPSAGLLTVIGPEHLERFGSMENIELAKLELIEALPPGGLLALNVDDPIQRRFIAKARHLRVVTYGLDAVNTPDVTAQSVAVTPEGISLDVLRLGKLPLRISCVLVGRHNVSNLLGAIAIADALGISDDDLAEAVAEVLPADHRLQILRPPGGAVVIDDSYNANPSGVRSALEVLAEMPGQKKVFVTPGVVELGPLEKDENAKIGAFAATVCSDVILVGPRRTEPIAAGLQTAGFPTSNMHIVSSLAAATEVLRRLIGPGDVVLFCNDLPDQYSE